MSDQAQQPNSPIPKNQLEQILGGAKQAMGKMDQIKEADKIRKGKDAAPEPSSGPEPGLSEMGGGGGSSQPSPGLADMGGGGSSSPQQPMGGQQMMAGGSGLQPNINEQGYIEEPSMQQQQPQMPQMGGNNASFEEKVKQSNFPENVKKAMLENQIEDPMKASNSTFNKEDVSNLIEKPQQPQQQTVNESRGQQQPQQSGGGLSESKIREIVKDEMISILSRNFTQELKDSLTEDLKKEMRKEVLNDLIKEGKIKKRKKSSSSGSRKRSR